MDQTINQEKKADYKKLISFVVEQVKSGTDQSVISQKLVEMGVEQETAIQIVREVHDRLMETIEKTRFTSDLILPALMGGVFAALVGGFIWALIANATGYEIGYMASGLGLITGYAVLFSAKGKKGLPAQIIAVFASIFGIVVAKYFIFLHILKEGITAEYGAEVASLIPIFSSTNLEVFFESLEFLLSGFDILWIFLAVIMAWQITKGPKIKSFH